MTLLLLFLQIPNFQIRSLSGDGNDGGICGICVPKTLGIGGGGGGGGGGGREGGRSRNYVKSWTEDFFSLCNATIHHFELALRILAVFQSHRGRGASA